MDRRPHRRRRRRVRRRTSACACRTPTSSREIDDNPFWTDDVGDPLAPTHVRRPDRRAGVPRRRVAGRADRRPLRHDARPLHRHRPLLRHARQRPAHRVDRARRLPPLRRVPRPVRRPARAVARRRPRRSRRCSSAAIFGTDQVTLPPDRFTGQTYEQALATFEAEPPIQVLFEEGAADGARPGHAAAPLDRVVRRVAGPGTTAHAVVPRRRRHSSTEAPAERRRRRRRTPPTRTPCRRRSSTATVGSIWATDVAVGLAGSRRTGTAASFVSRAARRRHGDRRLGLGRPVDPHRRRRHRPRGDAQRDPPRRPGGVRAERLAAGQPAGARRGREHRATTGAHAPRGRRRAARRRRVDAGARRAVPVRPRLPRRLAAAASPSTRRAATAPSGSSRRSPTARRSRSPTTPTTRRASCCPSSPASTCPPTYPACTLRGQPCRPVQSQPADSSCAAWRVGAAAADDGGGDVVGGAHGALHGVDVAELLAMTAARQPPRDEAGGEGVAGTDRVDDGHGIDGDHRRTRRRPNRRAAAPGGHEDDPVVTRATSSLSTADSHARSSSLALTTSALARTRSRPGHVRGTVADRRRAAVEVDDHHHVAARLGDDALDRRRHRLQHESEPAGHERRCRHRAAPPAPAGSRSCRRGRSDRSPRRRRRSRRRRASSAGQCAGRAPSTRRSRRAPS